MVIWSTTWGLLNGKWDHNYYSLPYLIKPEAYLLHCLITMALFTFLFNYFRYGVVIWSTTWGLLNGKWDRDYARTFGQVCLA